MTEEVISVSLDALVMLPVNQIRHQMCHKTVRHYAEVMCGGEGFAPIKVALVDPADDTKGFVLVDGWHRVAAAQRNSLRHIQAVVVTPAGPEEIPWLAAEANRRHGLPLSRLDKRNVFKAYVRAKKHRTGRGNSIKSAREMGKDLNGIVSRHQLPKWMQSEFPAIYTAMNSTGLEDPKTPGETFGSRDLDAGYITEARAVLGELMACIRAIGDNDTAREVLTDVAAAVTEVSETVTGDREWPKATFDF